MRSTFSWSNFCCSKIRKDILMDQYIRVVFALLPGERLAMTLCFTRNSLHSSRDSPNACMLHVKLLQKGTINYIKRVTRCFPTTFHIPQLAKAKILMVMLVLLQLCRISPVASTGGRGPLLLWNGECRCASRSFLRASQKWISCVGDGSTAFGRLFRV